MGRTRHRVDILSAVGEKDGHQDGTSRWRWDSGQRQALHREARAPFLQPKPDDVTPPALARRLIARIRPDQARPRHPAESPAVGRAPDRAAADPPDMP